MSRPPYGTGALLGSILGLLVWAGLLIWGWRGIKFLLGVAE